MLDEEQGNDSVFMCAYIFPLQRTIIFVVVTIITRLLHGDIPLHMTFGWEVKRWNMAKMLPRISACRRTHVQV